MIKNHPIEPEELMAYLDGELPAERAVSAAAHIEKCPECQRLAADLRSVSPVLASWQIESPEAGLPVTIASALSERRAPKRKRPNRLWTWGLASAAAMVVLVAGLWPGPWAPEKKTIMVVDQLLPSPEPQRIQYAGQQAGQAGQQAGQQGQTLFQKMGLANKADHFVRALREPMIARTARLNIATNDFDKARTSLDEILKRHGGYMGQLTLETPVGSGRVLDAALRVPSHDLEAVMTEVRKLGRVESESQEGEEVTQAYTDLEARLDNARNTEKRLTDLLAQRTGKLADVLSVEQEIDRVRGDIERMDADRKGMTGRVDFATLNVKVTEGYKAHLQPAPDSLPSRLRNAAVEGYQTMVAGVASVALAVLSYGPSLLLWSALLFFPVRLAWKRLRG